MPCNKRKISVAKLIALTALKSISAGFLIGLGGILFLSCDNKYIGAFMFSIGLMTILFFGLDLYTGKVCSYHQDFRLLPVILLGNYIGACITAILAEFHVGLHEKAAALAAAKLEKDYVNIFVDGIICGICIAIAVKGYVTIMPISNFGAILIVIMGVMAFILSGAEHVVADMFYLCFSYDIQKNLLFLLVTCIGNTIGGLSLGWLNN